MVDWLDPEVAQLCITIFEKELAFLLGVLSWHHVTTLNLIEIPLLTRRLKWKWAYLYYLFSRYFAILAVFSATSTNKTVLYFAATCGSISTICSTGNLLVRPLMLWRQKRLVFYFLVLVEVGHWVSMIVVTAVPVSWFKLSHTLDKVYHGYVAVYTLLFDFIILLCTAGGLYRTRTAHGCTLWVALYRQGLLYFMITCLVNVPLLVVCWLDLGPVMTNITAVPVVILSSMASSCLTFLLRPEIDTGSTRSLTTHVNVLSSPSSLQPESIGPKYEGSRTVTAQPITEV